MKTLSPTNTSISSSSSSTIATTNNSDLKYQNPFEYDKYLTWYERFKIILMCFTLIPLIRLVILVAISIVIPLLSCLALLGANLQPGQNLPKWRQIVFLLPIRLLTRLFLFALGFHYIHTKYPKDDDTRASVIVSNHVTPLDSLFMMYLISPSFVMMQELGKIPLVRSFIKCYDPVLIDRHTPSGRKAAADAVLAIATSSTRSRPLVIFPEGTTSRNDNLLQFKRGAFLPGMPVQPVVLKFPFKHCNTASTPYVSSLYLLFRLVCQVYNSCSIEFLPVYVPSVQEQVNPDTYACNVRNTMNAAIAGSKTSEYSVADARLMVTVGAEYAAKSVINHKSVQDICNLTRMNASEVTKLLQKFKTLDHDSDGLISESNVAQELVKSQTLLECRGRHHHQQDKAVLTFRDLCHRINEGHYSSQELISLAFNIYDKKNTGMLSTRDLESALSLSNRLLGRDSFTNHIAEKCSGRRYFSHVDFAVIALAQNTTTTSSFHHYDNSGGYNNNHTTALIA